MSISCYRIYSEKRLSARADSEMLLFPISDTFEPSPSLPRVQGRTQFCLYRNTRLMSVLCQISLIAGVSADLGSMYVKIHMNAYSQVIHTHCYSDRVIEVWYIEL